MDYLDYYKTLDKDELIKTLQKRDELIKHLNHECLSRANAYNVQKITLDFFTKKYEEEIEDLRRQLEYPN